MRAAEAKLRGLIAPGTEVFTYPLGEWPGGVAIVVDEPLDPGAPEIVFYVEKNGDRIGVFEYEQIIVLAQEDKR